MMSTKMICGCVVGDLGQRLEAVGRGDDVAALARKQRLRRAADGLGIVDDHHPQTLEADAGIVLRRHVVPLRDCQPPRLRALRTTFIQVRARCVKRRNAAADGRATGACYHPRIPPTDVQMTAAAPLDVVVVMDPIGSIRIAKDSTFAMLLEAQRRGHRLHYVRPGGLSVRDARAVATAATLHVRDDPRRPLLADRLDRSWNSARARWC